VINPYEAAVQRRLTEEFIKADGREVVLWRSVRQEDGAGGWTFGDPAPLPAQFMRLIPLRDGASVRMTADGQEVTPAYMLQGSHGADMERWDIFELEGVRYEVVFVNENRQYQVKGEVAHLG